MDQQTTIVPGQNLDHYPIDKFRAKSLRIDNPSGCWYQIQNNQQIIPPYSYGLTVVLDANTSSLTILFLSTFAGQQSKLVGNPVQVYITSEALTNQNALSIKSAIPYTNTFNWKASTLVAPSVNTPMNLLTIFPNAGVTGLRTRLTFLEIRFLDWTVQPTISPRAVIRLTIVTTSGAGGTLGTPSSLDSDANTQPNTFVRFGNQGANAPTVLTNYRFYSITLSKARDATIFGRSWNASGPDYPPSTYHNPVLGQTHGMAITISTLATDNDGTINIDTTASWTEEQIG